MPNHLLCIKKAGKNFMRMHIHHGLEYFYPGYWLYSLWRDRGADRIPAAAALVGI